MNELSVIIPSRNAANLAACVDAIRKHEQKNVKIIVIDDGVDKGSLPAYPGTPGCICWQCKHSLAMLPGEKPFVFARNVNRGIRAAVDDDVILLNDDALLESPGGFSAMQKEWYAHPSYGLISATTNLAGNPAQQPRRGRLGSPLRICPSPTPGNSFATVAFVCVFIPRATFGVVGMLDERFVAYGWEDNDYCRRVNKVGMLIGIFDGCFVDHSTLHSTFRGDAYAAGDINAGRAIYLEKWGSM